MWGWFSSIPPGMRLKSPLIAIVFGRIPILPIRIPSYSHHIQLSHAHTHREREIYIYIYRDIYSHHILFVVPFWCTWHASYIAIHPTAEVQDQGQQKAHRLLSAARWWCEGPPWWKSASLDGFKRHLTGIPWKTLTCHRKIHGFRRWWKLFGDLWCCYISYLHSTNLVVLHGFIRFVKVNLLQNLLLKPELLEARLLPRCLPVSDPCAGQGYLADTCDITCHSVETGVAVRPRSIHQWTGWRENLQRNHRFYVFFYQQL